MDFSPELLQVLLEKVAGTLEELDLILCGITDVHLMAFLTTLSCCSQLSPHHVRKPHLHGHLGESPASY